VDVVVLGHFAKLVEVPLCHNIVIFVLTGGDIGRDGQSVVILGCFGFWLLDFA